jgi:hypothetical protein
MTHVNLLRHEGYNFDEWLDALLKTDFLKGRNKARRLAQARRLNNRFVQRLVGRAEEITKQQVIQKLPAQWKLYQKPYMQCKMIFQKSVTLIGLIASKAKALIHNWISSRSLNTHQKFDLNTLKYLIR